MCSISSIYVINNIVSLIVQRLVENKDRIGASFEGDRAS